MKKILLGLSLSALAGTALAQDYDDRWRLSPTINFTATDSEKNIESQFGAGIGIGKFINPNWTLDFEIDHARFAKDPRPGSLKQTGYGLMARYHFNEGESLRPFIAMGAGLLDHDGQEPRVSSDDWMLNLGVGLRKTMTDRMDFISEIKYRLDTDDYTNTASSYDDYMFSMGVSIALGEARQAAPAEPVEPAPQLDSDGDGVSDQMDRCPNTPAGVEVDEYGCPITDGDDDNDGVPNSRDKCPDTRAGAVVDKDGCEVQVVIELQGVHFDFDKATLRPESIKILDAAVKTMGEHGTILVEVAGHTDSVGAESYNQDLSERRAKVVYDYLVDKGVEADRMTWKGYGENSPIATNETDEGRQRNRRTELQIQN
ncbi:OmpA family protein [Marinicella gelatinilytica]|uniref:OmpA family protein n=1 Tax=Marinicella gelatinilytica TaxID=2996017 RepID=UPI002260EA3F|nr:OmpA family protein [Marinicella gelatinilytica]MCX7543995.1 OmpA family protein [Marinicella gelatinilytica]